MPKIDHNGKGFYYMIHYRKNSPGYVEQAIIVSKWDTERVAIDIDHPDQPFQEYSIYIRAGNDRGMSYDKFIHKVLGFTGEGGECAGKLLSFVVL